MAGDIVAHASAIFAAAEDGIRFVLSEPGRGGRRTERLLLTGGQSASYESFHLFENRPQVSTSGPHRAVLEARGAATRST